MRAAVIIPTYNESQNIESLVNNILNLKSDIEIIIVDDNSPDGTGKIADGLASDSPYVYVVHRHGKGGRGSACIAGFKYALTLNVDYILEMDADFSHDPKAIPQFLEKARDFDVVIGSRYLKESRIIDWGPYRLIFSHFANLYARFLLRIPITDYTNGYRCYRKEALSNVDFDRINATGYIVLSEMAYQLYQRRAKFTEIPITFVNRRRGLSNLTLKETIRAFKGVTCLRWRKLWGKK